MIIKCVCEKCQAELADEVSKLSNDSGIGSLNAYCTHNNVGVNLDLINGVIVNWMTSPATSVADWQRLQTARAVMAPDILRIAQGHAVALRQKH